MKFDLLVLGDRKPIELLELSSQIEDYGFEFLWHADEKFYRDPYCSLTFISQHTKKIKLGTCITDPFTRHPAITAMTMASLDEISGGRCVLGIGAGFTGIAEMGIKAERTISVLREAVKIFRALWKGEVVYSNDGAVFIQNGSLDFKARRNIPIMLASSSPKILSLAGEIGDIQMLGALASKDVISVAKNHVINGAQKAGKDVSLLYLIARVNLVFSNDVSKAKDMMRPLIIRDLCRTYPRWNISLNYLSEWEVIFKPLIDEITSRNINPRNINDYDFFTRFSSLVPDYMIRNKALVGNEQQIKEQIEEVSSTGINHISLYPLPLPGQTVFQVLEEFNSRIMSEFLD